MAFEPEFSVTAKLLETVETIAALRERIAAATVQVFQTNDPETIAMLQKQAGTYTRHDRQVSQSSSSGEAMNERGGPSQTTGTSENRQWHASRQQLITAELMRAGLEIPTAQNGYRAGQVIIAHGLHGPILAERKAYFRLFREMDTVERNVYAPSSAAE